MGNTIKREMGKGKEETEISYWYTRIAGNQKTKKKKSRKSFRYFLPLSKSRANGQVTHCYSPKAVEAVISEPNGKRGEEPQINKKNRLQIERKSRLAEA